MYRWLAEKLGNVSVKTKLGVGFGLVLLLTLVITFTGWTGLGDVISRGDKLGYISSLNAFDKDRAIEQVAGYHEKLGHEFARRGIDRDWSKSLNVWTRQTDSDESAPLIARASIGQKGGSIAAR